MNRHPSAALLAHRQIAPPDLPGWLLAGAGLVRHEGAAPGQAPTVILHVISTSNPDASQAQGFYALPQALVCDLLRHVEAQIPIRRVPATTGGGHGPGGGTAQDRAPGDRHADQARWKSEPAHELER
jgi:hypothetical protein